MKELLRFAATYSAFSFLTGGARSFHRVIRDYIRPFPHARVLDVGCGPARLLRFLPPDITYHGIDISKKYISQAKEEFGDRATFEIANAATFGRSEEYDIVLALGLLHHLNDDEVRALLTSVSEILADGGRLITLDGVFCERQSTIAKYFLRQDRGKFVRTADAYRALLRERLVIAEEHTIHDLIRIPYSHYISVSTA